MPFALIVICLLLLPSALTVTVSAFCTHCYLLHSLLPFAYTIICLMHSLLHFALTVISFLQSLMPFNSLLSVFCPHSCLLHSQLSAFCPHCCLLHTQSYLSSTHTAGFYTRTYLSSALTTASALTVICLLHSLLPSGLTIAFCPHCLLYLLLPSALITLLQAFSAAYWSRWRSFPTHCCLMHSVLPSTLTVAFCTHCCLLHSMPSSFIVVFRCRRCLLHFTDAYCTPVFPSELTYSAADSMVPVLDRCLTTLLCWLLLHYALAFKTLLLPPVLCSCLLTPLLPPVPCCYLLCSALTSSTLVLQYLLNSAVTSCTLLKPPLLYCYILFSTNT